MKIQLREGRMLIALGCMCGLFGVADATENSDVVELGEVVVTATRTNVSLSDAPAAVTIVNSKNIETKNASRLGDVLDQVPSLYLQNGVFGQSQGTSGTSGMSLRGLDQNKTLVLLDGQPIQDGRSGKVNWRIPFVEDIARVEVVPGTFSSLYGSNAIGGVINIITKQPDKHELTAKVKKGWNDASGEDASIYFRDKLENGLGVVAGLGHQRRDSYVNDFVVRPAPVPPVPAGTAPAVFGAQAITDRTGAPAFLVGDLGTVPWTSTNATTKLYYDLNARDKVYAGIAYQETKEDYTQFHTYLTNAAGAPVSSGTVSIDGQQIVLTDFNFTLFSNLPLHETATRYFAGYDGAVGDDYLLKIDLARIGRAYSFTAADPTATWNSGPGTMPDTPNTGLDGTVQLSFPVGAKQFLVTGLALHRDTANQQIYALSNWRDPDSRTGVNGGYDGYSTTTSVFAQDEISAADAFKIYLGGRLDDWKTKGDSFQNAAPAGNKIFPARSVSAFSPKLSAIYKPAEAATLRASFGKSFRAPSNETMYTTSISRGRTTQGDPNLQPERGTTWEVGGEWRFADKTKAAATYYETQLTDLIYLKQLPIPPSLPQQSLYINAGKAKIRGIELAAAAKLTEWLDVDANYAYINSRILENLADPLSVGKRLTDSPKNIVGIELVARQGAWSGMLDARYISHVFATAQNTDVVEGVPGSFDAYTIVNTKIGYQFSKGAKGAIAVNNLLDRKAYSYFLLPGRNVTAEMDFSF